MPSIDNYLSLLGFIACRKVCLARGTHFSASPLEKRSSATCVAPIHRHRLQTIAIDCAGADGRPEGAGSTEPGPSTDQGSVGASVEQVAVPSAPPQPSARDKAAVRYRIEKERRLPKPPKSQRWLREFFMVYAKGGL